MTLRLVILDLKPDKAKLSTESFSKNSVLDINLALYQLSFFVLIRNTVLSIYAAPRKVKKVTSAFDSSKESSPECIPVVVLKDLIFHKY